ncbi:hypothetical protein V2J09_019269 [Rumex salicifolius]
MGTESRNEVEVPLLHPNGLDAGALFVLKPKGSWLHCGYHLTTSIVAPPLLNLPYAIALLGWVGGFSCLFIGALVTFYSYNLLSLVLEHQAAMGHRNLRYRDMANDILGERWGRYFVAPIQLIACSGAVVGSILLGGECIKIMYSLTCQNGEIKLYEFTTVFGIMVLILAQLPSFHSLRYVNLVSLLLSLLYSACVVAASISVGKPQSEPSKQSLNRKSSQENRDYSLSDNTEDRLMGFFSAIGIIATTYGNGIIPEIQATLAPPVKGKMFKGLCICYAVVMVTFFGVAISGYWAFGNQVDSLITTTLVDNISPWLPKWFILIIVILIIFQLSAVAGIYLQPTNEALERAFSDPSRQQFSARNVTSRVVTRSLAVVAATTIAVTLPYFGDINALVGALGFLPLDFVLPMILYNLALQPPKRSLLFWLNIVIALVFSLVMVVAVFAASRQIVLDVSG